MVATLPIVVGNALTASIDTPNQSYFVAESGMAYQPVCGSCLFCVTAVGRAWGYGVGD